MSEISPAERWEGALCTQTDPDLWFPEKGGSIREAVAICGRCPFGPGGDNACLMYALESETDGDNLEGIWGGVPSRARRKLRQPKTGPGGRTLAPCGTEAAYKRHGRRGEQPCEACQEAATAARRVRKDAA